MNAATKNLSPGTAGGIDSAAFGNLPDGRPVDVFTLRNDRGMSVSITNYGGIVTSLIAPDARGKFDDVVLGFDSLDPYLASHAHFGAIIGRYGNRIAGAAFHLDGQEHRLSPTEGRNHLHGGETGFDKVLWRAETRASSYGPHLSLSHISPDGDEGYPGALRTTVSYTLTDHNELGIHYRATTDKATHVNLTNHSYFNLRGAGAGEILEHLLTLDADAFTPVDEDLIPTGEIRPVAGTPFDFRRPTAVGARIDSDDAQLVRGRGYDHNWIINIREEPGRMPAATLVDPGSGRILEVLTTEPGIQVYTANHLDGSITGKAGRVYNRRCALCLETQHFPDSPNRPGFPSTVLRPGGVHESRTLYRFLTVAEEGQTPWA